MNCLIKIKRGEQIGSISKGRLIKNKNKNKNTKNERSRAAECQYMPYSENVEEYKEQNLSLPYSEELNIESLSRIFDDTSECYKFFWFKAIIAKVTEGKFRLTYEELVNEMITDAWYMVTEYHLNLGPKDTLESVVNLIKEKYPELKSCEKKSVILELLHNVKDKDIIAKRRTLTYNVPYRLQSPFMPTMKGDSWKVSGNKLIDRINQERRLIYYFSEYKALATEISIDEEWARYIVKNQEVIRGWLEYNMIKYLQKRNPSVPGIAEKLYPPQERNLNRVKKYWKMLIELQPIHEIYGENLLNTKDISIDHFVPWSYVAHDELWNLVPTTKSINSSKSNNLPEWETYFDRLARQEYQAYQMIWKYDSVHKVFEECAKEHINNDDIRYRVYRDGLEFAQFKEQLNGIILPVYQSAQNCGFNSWKYEVQR